jgi:hypothetical protein
MKLAILALAATLAMSAQTNTMTNDDVIKLSKSGLSESFVTDLIDKQGTSTRLSGDVSSLIQLKKNDVNERVISAVVKKSQNSEPLNTDSVVRLVQANFSDNFILDLLSKRPSKFSTDTSRVIELKQAGVSERLLSVMVGQSSTRELPSGTQISVRLIDAIDSETNKVGDQFSATLEEPMTVGNDVIAQKGAKATVKLVETEDSGKFKGRTSLTLQLVSVAVDGREVPITTSDVAQESGSRGARTAKSAAAVGAIGAIIGGIAGGGKGAAIGAGAGAAAGAGAQVIMDPQKVKIPSETVLKFTLDKPARI